MNFVSLKESEILRNRMWFQLRDLVSFTPLRIGIHFPFVFNPISVLLHQKDQTASQPTITNRDQHQHEKNIKA